MTSPSYRNVGLTQFLLATGFVLWLVFLPGLAPHFAWSIGSRLSSMFIGISFALRAFEGFFMWREPDWQRLRWMSWGTLAFLTFIFAATYWHLDLMNWTPFNIATVVWMLAYSAEPLVVPFVEPRGADANAGVPQGDQRGPVSGGLQTGLTIVMTVAAALFGMLFINPAKFAAPHWPWELTAFDARIASSFFAGIVLWAAKMKLAHDWTEIRMGVQGFILFFGGHFLVWIFNLATGQFDPARMAAVWIYGVVTGVLTAVLLFFYFAHEKR